MPRPVRSPAIALLAWSLAAAALAAGRFAAPGAGTPLEAGATARVAWDLPGWHGRGFGEMELVLSLDGGRTFPVRVTRDLDPSVRCLFFRVPALPTAHARLGLRAGDGAEPDAEEIVLVSDDFVIEADPASPLEPLASVRGEWRTREALESGAARAPADPRTVAAAEPVLDPARETPTAAAPQPRPPAHGAAPRDASTFEFTPAVPVMPPRPQLSYAPSHIPRRE
jgi:hypothetical protein